MASSIDTSLIGFAGSSANKDGLHYDHELHRVRQPRRWPATLPSSDTTVTKASQQSRNRAFRDKLVYKELGHAIKQYLIDTDAIYLPEITESQGARRRRIKASLDEFDRFGNASNDTSKPLNSIDDISEKTFKENKEAQINAFVPAGSTAQQIIAFPARKPVDGENKPFDMRTGVSRTAPLRGRRTSSQEKTTQSRLRGHIPGSSLLGNANLMSDSMTQTSARSPIGGSPSQVVSQLGSSRTDHWASGELQDLSSINRHSSASDLAQVGPRVEIAAGGGILSNETPHIPDRNPIFPNYPVEPASSTNPWVDQSLASVPTPDNTLRLAEGGRFSSQSYGFAPPMTSPTLSRPLFDQPTPLNLPAESQITRSTASSSRPGGFGDAGNPFWPDQSQVPESSALGTNRELSNLQSYLNPMELLNLSNLAHVAQDPQDEQIFEYLDFRQCSQDEVDDLEGKGKGKEK
jgi:hypothetical protein